MKKYLLFLLVTICFTTITTAQDFRLTNPKLINCNLIRVTPPLREISQANPPVGRKVRNAKGEEEEEDGQIKLHKTRNPNALPKGLDPALQKEYAVKSAGRTPATLNLNFPGQGYTGVNPSDNNMTSGPNHIVQMINNSSSSLIRIWDKAGNIVVNQIILSTITGHGGFGDPVVTYDNLADRYLLAEFGSTGNHIYICVSQTSDPAGAYYVYDYTTPNFPDYFKIGVWGNSYIVTSNENSPALYALDRTKMLAGTPTTVAQRFTIPVYPTIGFQAAAPVDIIGNTAAPANSPALFMRMADDAWTTGIVDRLEIFSLNVDWVTPANTTLTGPDLLPTLPFSTNFCGYTTFSCIPQQGSSVKLDPLREVLMNKVSYRNFGSYEAIVCCHVNDLDGTSHAGVRWYELRKTPPSTNWVIYQQGTYGLPADPLNRWMACIAINAEGSIGLGYNVSGTTSFPSVRFTGRRACDPLGVMTEPEQTVVAGTAPSASNRYGDYNGMTVDPADGSFWFTANYNPAAQWATRVANFSINSSCGGCSPSIVLQPTSIAVCAGATANFSVTANGSPLTYQWQLSTDGGATFSDIAGATASNYSFTASAAQNNYRYRCVITGTCAPTTATTTAAILTVNNLPVVNTPPSNAIICAGGNTSFTVAAAGTGISYQWQLSTNGGATFTNVANGGVYSGAATSTLNLTGVTAGLNNNQYRCVVSGTCTPAANSAAGILTVNTAPAFTQQPASTAVCAGNSVSFSVLATGTAIGYQWQVSTDAGVTFNNIGGATASTYTFTATLAQNTYQYRCVVTGTCTPAATSTAATLTVGSTLIINTQPANAIICEGGNTTYAVAVTGTVTYQWQLSTNGGTTYTDITNGGIYSGATTAVLSLTGVPATANNNLYRCVISGNCPSINSLAVSLTVNTAPLITAQPAAGSTICAAQNTSFSVTATGTAITYQWQLSTDGGATYSNIVNGGVYSTATTPTLNITGAIAGMNTYKYRCIISGTCSPAATTTASTLTVYTPVSVTANPVNVIVCESSNASFSVSAAGTSPSYQWQVSSNGGATYTNISNSAIYTGTTTATLSLVAVPFTLNGYQYRCIVNGLAPCGFVNSAPGILNINPLPFAFTLTGGGAYCVGNNGVPVGLNLSAVGINYQLQLNGVNTGNPIAGTGGPLNFGNKTAAGVYTVVAYNATTGCTQPMAGSATVIVNPLPTLSLTVSPYKNLFPGLVTTLTATATSAANPINYFWFKNNLLQNNPGSTLSVNILNLGDYKVTITDANGCNNQSQVITIADSANSKLFIYPSPNNGQFTIAYYNQGGLSTKQIVTIYSNKGDRVYTNEFAVNLAYQLLSVDLRKYSAGIYYVILADATGKKIKTGEVIIR
jgi:hypothetical protein